MAGAMTRTAVAIALFTIAVGLSAPLSHGDASPYGQSTFPCEEDEVLGYHPRFGPDHVGCIHVDELR